MIPSHHQLYLINLSLVSHLLSYLSSTRSTTAPFTPGELRRSRTLQEAGDLLQLGDVVLPVAAVLLQQGEDAVVLAAGVGGVQRLQLLEDGSPGGLLLRRVLHLGDHLATRGQAFG